MKPNVIKPLVLFIAFILFLSAAIVYSLQISIPTFPKIPLLGSSKTTTTKQSVSIASKNGSIVLSYGQVENIMSECCNSFVSDVKATNTKNNKLALTGKALKPLTSDFSAEIALSVAEGKLKSSIDYLKVGKIESPSFLRDPLNSAIQNYFDTKINSQYKLKSVRIEGEGIILELI